MKTEFIVRPKEGEIINTTMTFKGQPVLVSTSSTTSSVGYLEVMILKTDAEGEPMDWADDVCTTRFGFKKAEEASDYQSLTGLLLRAHGAVLDAVSNFEKGKGELADLWIVVDKAVEAL